VMMSDREAAERERREVEETRRRYQNIDERGEAIRARSPPLKKNVEAIPAEAPRKSIATPAKIIPTEWRRVVVTIERPSERGPGRIEEGLYRIEGSNTVVVEGVGIADFRAGDDAEVIARKILLRKKPRAFHDPISYPRLSSIY
jgi:hypothetical protein